MEFEAILIRKDLGNRYCGLIDLSDENENSLKIRLDNNTSRQFLALMQSSIDEKIAEEINNFKLNN